MSLRRLQVKDRPPYELVEDFARTVATGGPVYVPMVYTLGQLEPYLDERENFDLVRVFHKQEDAQKFLVWVATTFGLGEDAGKFWVAEPARVCVHLAKVAATRKRILRCVGSGVYRNKIYDLEVFWTNDQSLMV